jgi:D-alanyl-D-alanine carboxypeptidase (penicillin-binding protein 5/6)
MAASMEAPLIEGEAHGELRVGLDGELLAKQPMIVLRTVREGSLWRRASDSVRLLFQ